MKGGAQKSNRGSKTYYYLTAVLGSSLLAVVSFLFPWYCAECIVISLMVLFFAAFYDFTFLTVPAGFLWGMFFNGCYFVAVFYCMRDHSSQHWIILIAVYLAFISYCSLLSALWFWLWGFLIPFFSKRFSFLTSINMSGIVSTFLYYILIEKYLFIIFGCIRGNSLQSFLVPLAARSLWFGLFSLFSWKLLLLFFISFSAITALVFYKRYFILYQSRHLEKIMDKTTAFNLRVEFIYLACAGIFLVIAHIGNTDNAVPRWIDCVCCFQPIRKSRSARELAYVYSATFMDTITRYPALRYLIVPESAFPFPLNKYPDLVQVMTDQLPESTVVIIGSHFEHPNGQLTNCCYCLNRGRIIYRYEKKLYLFFTEYVPSFWRNFSFLHHLFLKDKVPFDPHISGERLDWELRGLPSCAPAICADLFLEGGALAQAPQSLVIALVNDSWFSCQYARNLMFLTARLKAALFGKSILYVSHEFALLLTPCGKEMSLNFSRR